VLEDARNLVYLAKRTEQIDSLAWEEKADGPVIKASDLDSIDVSITFELGQPNDSAPLVDISCEQYFEYSRAAASFSKSVTETFERLGQQNAGNVSGYISQSKYSAAFPDLGTLSQSPISQAPLLESLLETFAGLRWRHHASAKSWLEGFNRVFSSEKSAMEYLRSAFSTSPTDWSRNAIFLAYPYDFNLLALSSNDSMVTESIFDRLLGLKVPKEQFSAAPWEKFLCMEPQLVRLLPLAAKVDEYVADSRTEYPTHLTGFKELILETCIKALSLDAHPIIAARLRDSLGTCRARTNSLTPADKVRSACCIPIKGLDPARLNYLEGLLELGLFGDASLAMGPDLLLVSDNDSHEQYSIAVECLRALANDKTPTRTSKYYRFVDGDSSTTLTIQKQIALCFESNPGSEGNGSAVEEKIDVIGSESVTRGPIECKFGFFKMRNLLARFSLGGRREDEPPKWCSWDAIALFPKVCSVIIDKAERAAMVDMAAEAAAELQRRSMVVDALPDDSKRLT
jgi:hypothetical protein